jgi:hypothetical protein
MNKLHFALWAIILLCIFGACSIGSMVFDEETNTEETEWNEPPDIDDGGLFDGIPDNSGNEPEEPPAAEEPEDDPPAEDDPEDDPGDEPPTVDDPEDLPAGDDPEDDPPAGDDPGDDPEDEPEEDLPAEDDPEDDPFVEDEPEDSPVTPVLVINELRTLYSGTQFRSEFIEFKANAPVNLDGMQVFISSNTKNPMVYEFLPVEIKKGEYFVLHLRTVGEGCVDEYGDDLAESGGWDSSPETRDFWIPGNTKLLRSTDAVYIQDKNGKLIDAVMLNENSDSWGTRGYLTDTAGFLFNHGVWKSIDGGFPGPMDAVNTSGIGTALTRSISRDETAEYTGTAADWYITITRGVTPGKQNNPGRLNN